MKTKFQAATEILKMPIAAKWKPINQALLSLGVVAITTAALSLFVKILPLQHITVVYLIPVLIASMRWGLIPGLIAVLGSTLAADFFFYTPYYSFWMSDPQEVVELVLFSIVSLVTSHLAAKAKHETEQTRQREREFHELYAFAKRLAVSYTASAINSAIQDHLTKILGRRAVLFRNADGYDGKRDALGNLNVPEPVKLAAKAISTSTEPNQKEALVDDLAGGLWLVRAISNKMPELGVVLVHLGSESEPR